MNGNADGDADGDAAAPDVQDDPYTVVVNGILMRWVLLPMEPSLLPVLFDASCLPNSDASGALAEPPRIGNDDKKEKHREEVRRSGERDCHRADRSLEKAPRRSSAERERSPRKSYQRAVSATTERSRSPRKPPKRPASSVEHSSVSTHERKRTPERSKKHDDSYAENSHSSRAKRPSNLRIVEEEECPDDDEEWNQKSDESYNYAPPPPSSNSIMRQLLVAPQVQFRAQTPVFLPGYWNPGPQPSSPPLDVGLTTILEEEDRRRRARDARSIFIKNIPTSFREVDILALHKNARRVHFSTSHQNAFLIFDTASAARAALSEVRRLKISGRPLTVFEARSPQERRPIRPRTLYVGGLHPDVTPECVQTQFPRSVEVVVTPPQPGGLSAMAFVRFRTKQDALLAFMGAEEKAIGGRKVDVYYARQWADDAELDDETAMRVKSERRTFFNQTATRHFTVLDQ